MPHLEPFTAARPDPSRAPLATFIAPPYDVIAPAERAALAAGGANIVELTLPQGDDRYAAAAQMLETWLADGTLVIDEQPAVYLYEQRSTIHGEAITVRGVLAAVRLDPPGEGGVLPHERVYDAVVGDRLELLRATGCDLEPIIAIYDGAGGAARAQLDAVQARPPLLEVTSSRDGDHHRLWRIDAPEAIAALRADLEPRTMVIADGHHRWTTARKLAAERGETGSMLMLLQDTGAAAPALLAIHRVITDRSLEQVEAAAAKLGEVTPLEGRDPEGWARAIADASEPDLIAFDTARAIRIRLSLSPDLAARDRLEVAVLHERLFDELLEGADVTYAHTPTEVAERIAEAGVGILIRPTPLAAVLEIAGSGEPMPRKSTFFLPKPISGLLLRPHDANRTD